MIAPSATTGLGMSAVLLDDAFGLSPSASVARDGIVTVVVTQNTPERTKVGLTRAPHAQSPAEGTDRSRWITAQRQLGTAHGGLSIH